MTMSKYLSKCCLKSKLKDFRGIQLEMFPCAYWRKAASENEYLARSMAMISVSFSRAVGLSAATQ